MSYCRFGEADAYIYDDIYHGIVCCACHLMYDGETQYDKHLDVDWPVLKNFVAGYDRQKMLDHIEEHRDAGDFIPFDVDLRLRKEIEHIPSCPCNRADERGCYLIGAKDNKCIACECEESNES